MRAGQVSFSLCVNRAERLHGKSKVDGQSPGQSDLGCHYTTSSMVYSRW